MKWINCLERMPDDKLRWYVFRQKNNTRSACTFWLDDMPHPAERMKLPLDQTEWLEESNDPVFSLEDMKLCWIMCDELHSERSGHCLPAKFYKEFMKTKYNIDHE